MTKTKPKAFMMQNNVLCVKNNQTMYKELQQQEKLSKQPTNLKKSGEPSVGCSALNYQSVSLCCKYQLSLGLWDQKLRDNSNSSVCFPKSCLWSIFNWNYSSHFILFTTLACNIFDSDLLFITVQFFFFFYYCTNVPGYGLMESQT